jgi:YidC/Oxa1 family membrane protein insertase
VERRVFIAILLSAVVMYGYQALFVPAPKPPVVPAQTDVPQSRDRVAGGEPAIESPAEVEVQATTGEEAERDIVVDTRSVEVVLTNRGGQVKHWRLKEYPDAAGKWIDLVPSNVPPNESRPFSLVVDDERITRRLQRALYRVTGDASGRVTVSADPATVVFEFADAAGLRARKQFRFDPRDYTVTVSATVEEGDRSLNPAVAWGPGLDDAGAAAGGGSFFTGNYVQPPGVVLHRDGGVERPAVSDVGAPTTVEGAFRFVGVDDHYFMAVALNTGQARLEFRQVRLADASGVVQRQLVSQTLHVATLSDGVRFFAGPKQFDLLKSVDAELVRAINYGMFDWLVVPLLSALKWLYGYLGNYGWAIVTLTVLINLALAPLRHKTVVSMRKMQEIQPQMKAIQERYSHLKASDPERQKMNTEIMALYREKGANPASGCVPTLLTLPVLIAFYSLLSMSIELRGAPFGWWIRDLSAADPYYVLPALMGVTMFWQQWISPSTADPVQQRVMMIMPLMFTAMMAFSPSGAVLYWFIGQLWAIGQQYFTNWLIGPPLVGAVKPAAERRAKDSAAGRRTGAR